MAAKYKVIQSLARASAIIDCFDESNRELTINQISDKTELNINTTRGLVQTLLYLNYLSYDETVNRYRLGIRFIEKAEMAQFDYTEKIIDLIRERMQIFADNYSVSIRLLTISNISTTSILEAKPSNSRYILYIHDQTDFPLHASATGKLILAHMEEKQRKKLLDDYEYEIYGSHTITEEQQLVEEFNKVEETGIAYEAEELGDGYSSVAIPIFRKDGQLIYSISTTGTSEIVRRNADNIIKDMKEIKQLIIDNVELN